MAWIIHEELINNKPLTRLNLWLPTALGRELSSQQLTHAAASTTHAGMLHKQKPSGFSKPLCSIFSAAAFHICWFWVQQSPAR